MTIQELREKRAKAWDTARDFLDSKRQANGTLSEEDSKTYDAMEATIMNLGKEIQRMTKLLGTKKFNTLLGSMIEKPKGKPTLVPESDKRPAWTIDDFKEETENE